MTTFLTALLPIILVVLFGRLIAWRKIITFDGWRTIEQLTYFLLFPVLIVRELSKASFDTAPWGIAISLVAAQLVLGAIGLIARRLELLSGVETGVIIQSNVRFNSFVALSLAGSLFGLEGLALAAVAVAAMVPTSNILSVWALARFSDKSDETEIMPTNMVGLLIRNPLIVACAVGISMNLSGLTPTGVVDSTMELIAQCAIGLGLLTAGAGVDVTALKSAGIRTFAWSVFRLLTLPAFAIAFAVLFDLSGLQLAIVAIAAATPTATSGYILAQKLGGDAPFAANLIAAQTVLALVTMPLVYWLLPG